MVTRAFFAQGDLGDVEILIDFHATLEAGLHSGGFTDDSEAVLYMGTSLRELVYKWRYKTLVLLKLLLLQRKVSKGISIGFRILVALILNLFD